MIDCEDRAKRLFQLCHQNPSTRFFKLKSSNEVLATDPHIKQQNPVADYRFVVSVKVLDTKKTLMTPVSIEPYGIPDCVGYVQ